VAIGEHVPVAGEDDARALAPAVLDRDDRGRGARDELFEVTRELLQWIHGGLALRGEEMSLSGGARR
jgi:hypothetical protein